MSILASILVPGQHTLQHAQILIIYLRSQSVYVVAIIRVTLPPLRELNDPSIDDERSRSGENQIIRFLMLVRSLPPSCPQGSAANIIAGFSRLQRLHSMLISYSRHQYDLLVQGRKSEAVIYKKLLRGYILGLHPADER